MTERLNEPNRTIGEDELESIAWTKDKIDELTPSYYDDDGFRWFAKPHVLEFYEKNPEYKEKLGTRQLLIGKMVDPDVKASYFGHGGEFDYAYNTYRYHFGDDWLIQKMDLGWKPVNVFGRDPGPGYLWNRILTGIYPLEPMMVKDRKCIGANHDEPGNFDRNEKILKKKEDV